MYVDVTDDDARSSVSEVVIVIDDVTVVLNVSIDEGDSYVDV